jgi:hypothetical protein
MQLTYFFCSDTHVMKLIDIIFPLSAFPHDDYEIRLIKSVPTGPCRLRSASTFACDQSDELPVYGVRPSPLETSSITQVFSTLLLVYLDNTRWPDSYIKIRQ